MALPMKKKAMKGMKAMKAMKARKSKVAKGKLAKAMVLRGAKEKTASGLKKEDLFKNKRGKIVSRKAAAAGKKAYVSYLKGWIESVMAARKELGITGFVAVNGKTPQG